MIGTSAMKELMVTIMFFKHLRLVYVLLFYISDLMDSCIFGSFLEHFFRLRVHNLKKFAELLQFDWIYSPIKIHLAVLGLFVMQLLRVVKDIFD